VLNYCRLPDGRARIVTGITLVGSGISDRLVKPILNTNTAVYVGS
jgi:hypothetical protein